MTLRVFRKDLPLLTVVAVLLLALLTFAYLGFFARYMADDYCLSAQLRRLGFLRAQQWWYMNWTGRFSYVFLISIAERIGPVTVPYLPLMALVCWLAAAIWSIHQISLIAQWPRPWLVSVMLAEIIIFATLNCAPNLEQSFYWQSGMITYISPLVLLTLYIGIVIYSTRRRQSNHGTRVLLIVCIVLTLVAGGFSEIYAVVQTGSLILTILVIFSLLGKPQRAALPFIIAGLVGSLISLVVMATAPGNWVRRTRYPHVPLIDVGKVVIYYCERYIGRMIYYSPLSTALLVFGPALLALYLYRRDASRLPDWNYRKVKVAIVLLPVLTLLLVIASFVPGAYATSAEPDWRGRFIPQFVLSCTIVGWSFLLGLTLMRCAFFRRSTLMMTGSGLLALTMALSCATLSIRRNLKLLPHARSNALRWDQTDREIRAARAQGRKDLTIPAIDDVETALGAPWNEMQITSTPKKWINGCVADYYEVNSIEAR